MRRNRQPRASVDHEWLVWRQAADRVQALWKDVRHARLGLRAAAYAEYCQALRREEHAAHALAARLTDRSCADVHAMAA